MPTKATKAANKAANKAAAIASKPEAVSVDAKPEAEAAPKPSAEAVRSARYAENNAASKYAGASTTATTSGTRNGFKQRGFAKMHHRTDDKLRALHAQYGSKPFTSTGHDKAVLEYLAFAELLVNPGVAEFDYKLAPYAAAYVKAVAPLAAGEHMLYAGVTEAVARAKAA